MIFERLPTALLREIAFALGRNAIVVALSSRDLAAARRACRDGVDDSERTRIPGVALTIREAEERLRGEFGLGDDELVTREAAGRCLFDAVDFPLSQVGTYNEVLSEVFESQLFSTLLAYGADPDADPHWSILHLLTEYETPNALEMARQLLAAGADVNIRCAAPNGSGRSALAWAVCSLSRENYRATAFQLGSLLIDHGADVVQSERDYIEGGGISLLGHLADQDWEDDATAAAASELRKKMEDVIWLARKSLWMVESLWESS